MIDLVFIENTVGSHHLSMLRLKSIGPCSRKEEFTLLCSGDRVQTVHVTQIKPHIANSASENPNFEPVLGETNVEADVAPDASI